MTQHGMIYNMERQAEAMICRKNSSITLLLDYNIIMTNRHPESLPSSVQT